MKASLKTLTDLGLYSYEETTFVSIIQALQLNNHSVWLTDGRYKQFDTLDTKFSKVADELIDNAIDDGENFLYLYRPLPPHRCFSLDREDLYEYPQLIFEDNYLCNSLSRCNVAIKDVDEYEDSEGNLHLITNLGDFLICPYKFRASHTHNYLKWQAATAKILLMLNTLLSQADSDEAFYVLGEKDEQILNVVLLNSSMLNFLQNTQELPARDIPKPINEYFESLLP